MHCKDAQILVHGYLDNELTPIEAAALQSHLAQCAECNRCYVQQQTLRTVLATRRADHFPAPQELRNNILDAIAAEDATTQFKPFRWQKLQLAAMLAGTVILTWSLTYFGLTPNLDERFADEAVSSYLRSQLVDHLTDIRSSDPEIVQSWLAARLDFIPAVKDLSAQDFLLVGGRLDYMYDRKVAAVIYQRGQNIINLFIWPATTSVESALRPISEEGYSILLWAHSGVNFCSISTLGAEALTALAKAYGAQAGPVSRSTRYPLLAKLP